MNYINSMKQHVINLPLFIASYCIAHYLLGSYWQTAPMNWNWIAIITTSLTYILVGPLVKNYLHGKI